MTSTYPLRSIHSKLLSSVFLLCFLLWGCGPSAQEIAQAQASQKAKAEQDRELAQVDQFIVQAQILDSATEQGLPYSEFNSQLARARAMFELAYPGEAPPEKSRHFQNAINGWLLVSKIWKTMLQRGEFQYLYPRNAHDIQLLNEYREVFGSEPPTPVHDKSIEILYIPGRKLIQSGLGFSSEEFRAGKADVLSQRTSRAVQR